MAQFCLPKFAADAFKAKLRDGSIAPEKLIEMSSEERRTLFSETVGAENARHMNAQFESKLLLKNQQAGIRSWVMDVLKDKPAMQRDVLSRVEKMTEVFQPKEQQAFLEDLAAEKVGAKVTMAEAGEMANLGKAVQDAKVAMEAGPRRTGHVATATEMTYGRALKKFGNYVSDLKNEANKLTLRERLNPSTYGKQLVEGAGIAKGSKASMDNSGIFRQGWKTMITHPPIWMRNARESIGNIVKQLGGKEVMDEVHAYILSDPMYGLAKRAKLDVGDKLEEQFPSHVVGKIPVYGRGYKASEAAYTAFVQRTRFDVFKKEIQIAQRAGVNINDTAQLESIAKMVNSLTGRGHLGKLEPAAEIANNVFFSPRFFKSNLDFISAHQLQKGVTMHVRKRAAFNLGKGILAIASTMAIANAIKPGSATLNPTSSKFGKVCNGNICFDLTAGMGSMAVLAARLATSETTNADGKVTELNKKDKHGKAVFGAPTKASVIWNFVEGKLSPAFATATDEVQGQDFDGNDATAMRNLINLLAPIPLTNIPKIAQDQDATEATRILAIMAELFGVSTTVYTNRK